MSLTEMLRSRLIKAGEDAAEDDHSLSIDENVDLSFGLKEEVVAIGDAVGEALGIGPISAIDMDANTVRVSALQIQKQLAMEAVNIVNGAPKILLSLFA